MLPGFDGTGVLYEPLIAALGEQCDCVAVHYENHQAVDGYHAQIRAACAGDAPIVLLAESFSGPLALATMAALPDQVVAGVLSTTFAKPPLALVISLAQKLRLASFTLPTVSEQVLRLFCLNGVRDVGLIREIAGVVRGVDAATMASRINALTHMDATAHLAQIRQPVLMLHAEEDRVVRRRFSDSLVQGLANVQEVSVRGPHLLLQARADACAAEIQQFLKTLG